MTPHIVAVDPGHTRSAWVRFDGSAVLQHAKEDNDIVLDRIAADGRCFNDAASDTPVMAMVFEQIEGFGMAVGREVFETVFWTGRFYEAARVTAHRLTRKAVKLHLCQTLKAKDPNIRQALLDRFGGKDIAIGRKHTAGPLYGIAADEWSALAVACTWWDQHQNGAL